MEAIYYLDKTCIYYKLHEDMGDGYYKYLEVNTFTNEIKLDYDELSAFENCLKIDKSEFDSQTEEIIGLINNIFNK